MYVYILGTKCATEITPSSNRRSMGPVVNTLAIFSNANILKNKIIKIISHQRYRLSVMISINVAFLTKERKNKKRRKK